MKVPKIGDKKLALIDWQKTSAEVTAIVTSTIRQNARGVQQLIDYHPEPGTAKVSTRAVMDSKGLGHVIKFNVADAAGWKPNTIALLTSIEFVLSPGIYKEVLVARPRFANGSLGFVDVNWQLHYARIEETLNNPGGYSTILQWYQAGLDDYVFTCWKW